MKELARKISDIMCITFIVAFVIGTSILIFAVLNTFFFEIVNEYVIAGIIYLVMFELPLTLMPSFLLLSAYGGREIRRA